MIFTLHFDVVLLIVMFIFQDLNSSFDKLPAISATKKVAGNGQAWVV